MPPTRIGLAVFLIGIIAMLETRGQHLSAARPISIGSYTALASDINGMDWNPAALVSLSDWTLSVTNFVSTTGSTNSLTLQTVVVGRPFSGGHTIAFRYSPGMSLNLVDPDLFLVPDPSFVTRYEKKIRYIEYGAVGHATRPLENLSVGAGIHLLGEEVTDTRFSVDSRESGVILQSSPVDFSGSHLAFDLGAIWTPSPNWRVGVVAKNIAVRLTSLPDEVSEYHWVVPAAVRVGLGYSGIPNLVVGFDGDSRKQFRAGGEWGGPMNVRLGGGLHVNGSSPLSLDAVSLGAGITFSPVQLDLSYLSFASGSHRGGAATVETFRQHDVNTIDFNPFTRDRLSLTATVQLGRTREVLAQVEYVDMLGEIYPALQPVYAFRPVATAHVRNISQKPIVARVKLFVDQFMNAPTESAPVMINAGELAEVPLFAVFNNTIRANTSVSVFDGEVTVSISSDEDHNDRYPTRVLVRGRHDWNGDVSHLRYFVTPNDSQILHFTRTYLNHHKAILDTVPRELMKLAQARIIFEELAMRLLYVSDPRESRDYVQYPTETLNLRSGDCDDLSVLYSSLLASMGISTAFVDVVPPERPDLSHVYLMFDSGLDPRDASLVSTNPKRYVVRADDRGAESVWIPVETTAVTKGFAEAWAVGAQQYFNDVEVNLGLAKGWIRLVDLEPAY